MIVGFRRGESVNRAEFAVPDWDVVVVHEGNLSVEGRAEVFALGGGVAKEGVACRAA